MITKIMISMKILLLILSIIIVTGIVLGIVLFYVLKKPSVSPLGYIVGDTYSINILQAVGDSYPINILLTGKFTLSDNLNDGEFNAFPNNDGSSTYKFKNDVIIQNSNDGIITISDKNNVNIILVNDFSVTSLDTTGKEFVLRVTKPIVPNIPFDFIEDDMYSIKFEQLVPGKDFTTTIISSTFTTSNILTEGQFNAFDTDTSNVYFFTFLNSQTDKLQYDVPGLITISDGSNNIILIDNFIIFHINDDGFYFSLLLTDPTTIPDPSIISGTSYDISIVQQIPGNSSKIVNITSTDVTSFTLLAGQFNFVLDSSKLFITFNFSELSGDTRLSLVGNSGNISISLSGTIIINKFYFNVLNINSDGSIFQLKARPYPFVPSPTPTPHPVFYHVPAYLNSGNAYTVILKFNPVFNLADFSFGSTFNSDIIIKSGEFNALGNNDNALYIFMNPGITIPSNIVYGTISIFDNGNSVMEIINYNFTLLINTPIQYLEMNVTRPTRSTSPFFEGSEYIIKFTQNSITNQFNSTFNSTTPTNTGQFFSDNNATTFVFYEKSLDTSFDPSLPGTITIMKNNINIIFNYNFTILTAQGKTFILTTTKPSSVLNDGDDCRITFIQNPDDVPKFIASTIYKAHVTDPSLLTPGQFIKNNNNQYTFFEIVGVDAILEENTPGLITIFDTTTGKIILELYHFDIENFIDKNISKFILNLSSNSDKQEDRLRIRNGRQDVIWIVMTPGTYTNESCIDGDCTTGYNPNCITSTVDPVDPSRFEVLRANASGCNGVFSQDDVVKTLGQASVDNTIRYTPFNNSSIGGNNNGLKVSDEVIKLYRGSYYDYNIPDSGIASLNFHIRTGCDANGQNCEIGDDKEFSSRYVDTLINPPTGAQAFYSAPVNTLFEATFSCILPQTIDESGNINDNVGCGFNPGSKTTYTNPTHEYVNKLLGDSFIDLSMANGFTNPVIIYIKNKDGTVINSPTGCQVANKNGKGGDVPYIDGPYDCSGVSLASCPNTDLNFQVPDIRLTAGTLSDPSFSIKPFRSGVTEKPWHTDFPFSKNVVIDSTSAPLKYYSKITNKVVGCFSPGGILPWSSSANDKAGYGGYRQDACVTNPMLCSGDVYNPGITTITDALPGSKIASGYVAPWSNDDICNRFHIDPSNPICNGIASTLSNVVMDCDINNKNSPNITIDCTDPNKTLTGDNVLKNSYLGYVHDAAKCPAYTFAYDDAKATVHCNDVSKNGGPYVYEVVML